MEVVEVVEFLAYPHDSGVGGVCGVGIRSHWISYITGYLRALKPSLLKAAYPTILQNIHFTLGVGGVCGVDVRSHVSPYSTVYLRALKQSPPKAANPHDSTNWESLQHSISTNSKAKPAEGGVTPLLFHTWGGGVCGVGVRSHGISYSTVYLRASKSSPRKAAYPHDSAKYTFHT